MIYDKKLARNCIAAAIRNPLILADVGPYVSDSDFGDNDRLNRTIYSILLDLSNKKQEILPITVAQKIKNVGITFKELEGDIGDYLDEVSRIQVTEKAGIEFFKQLKKVAIRRDIAEMCDRLKEEMIQGKDIGDVSLDEIVNRSDKMYGNTFDKLERMGEEEFYNIYENLERDVMERANNPVDESGPMTPFTRINEVFGSLLRPGNIMLVAARTGSYKAQPTTEPVLTEYGWKQLGELKVGDRIYDHKARLVRVTHIMPQGVKDVYRVIFDDGGETLCCDDHLWMVRSHKNRKNKEFGSVLPLKDIRKDYILGAGRKNYSIPFPQILDFPKKDLPIDPYLMGVLLGDGSFCRFAITCADNEIIDKCKNIINSNDLLWTSPGTIRHNIKRKTRTNDKSETYKSICALGLDKKRSYEKFIPDQYLYSSKEDRIEILRGLMDTDGSCSKTGAASFRTTSPFLKNQVLEIVRSLGGRASYVTHKSYYKKNGARKYTRDSYQISISFKDINPFFLKRKADLFKFTSRPLERYIAKITKQNLPVECLCIKVDSDDELYLTRDYIVTHNSTIAAFVMTHLCEKYKHPILHLDCGEMTAWELQCRAVNMLSNGVVPYDLVENGKWAQNEELKKIVPPLLKRVQKLNYHYRAVGGMSDDEKMSVIRRFYMSKVGRGNYFAINDDYPKSYDDIMRNRPEWLQLDFTLRKTKNLIKDEIKTCGYWCSAQRTKDGITGNKNAAQIDDTEATVAGTDRISHSLTHGAVMRWKTPQEQADEPGLGNMIMKFFKARHLGSDPGGFRNLVEMPDGSMQPNRFLMKATGFSFEEIGDLISLQEQFGKLIVPATDNHDTDLE